MPLLFLRSCLKAPLHVGSIAPSSRYLAEALARQAAGADCILEVGAGSGALTGALLRQGVPVVALERDPHLAHQLALRHPGANTHAVSLECADKLLAALPARTCVVSALPFRSLPAGVSRQLADLLCEFVCQSPERWLAQFSYAPQIPFGCDPALTWSRAGHVLRNIPPAFLWKLTHRR